MNFNTLLAGGLAAAIVGAWQQVKAVFGYVSSFVIVQAKLDYNTSAVIREHIKKEWRLLPSGLVSYKSRYITFKDDSHCTVVPFKLPAKGGIFVKGWKVLFVTFDGEVLGISYIRGLVNFDDIVRTTIRAYNLTTKDISDKTPNRFTVIRHMGREKSAYASPSPRPLAGSNGTDATELPLDGPSYLDITIDKPLLYDKSMWMFEKEEDPFKGLYFPPHILDYVKQLQHWSTKGQWYADRMIPYRRGVLFYGMGGTGKTSLAKAIAQVIKIPVHQYYLSTMSDQEFVEAWDNMSTPCVALLEDFDNVFHGRKNIVENSTLTFDCVLNQISGINSHNGVLLIVTTNHIEHIDPAMGVAMKEGEATGVSTRPGRIDKVIEVGYLEAEGRKFLANRILKDWPHAIEQMVNVTYNVTPAQFQEMCVQEAFNQMRLDDEKAAAKCPPLSSYGE